MFWFIEFMIWWREPILCSQVRVSAIFAFVSFVILLSFSGVPAHIDEVKVSPLPLHGACTACVLKTLAMVWMFDSWMQEIFCASQYLQTESRIRLFWNLQWLENPFEVTIFYTVQIYCHEETNRHSGAMVFLLGQLLSSIPFVFLVSISSSLVFYYLIGLRNEFSLLMYFVVTIFMCLLANEALMMIVAYIWLETHKCTLTLACLYVSVCIAPFFFCMHAIAR